MASFLILNFECHFEPCHLIDLLMSYKMKLNEDIGVQCLGASDINFIPKPPKNIKIAKYHSFQFLC